MFGIHNTRNRVASSILALGIFVAGITVAFAAAPATSPHPTSPPGGYIFADVPPTHPFFNYIESAAEQGIINGYNCGGVQEPCDQFNRPYFRPNNKVTRAQVMKIVMIAAGRPLITPQPSPSPGWQPTATPTPTAPSTQPSVTPTPGQVSACPAFPANNIWNARVDTLPVAAQSNTWINMLGPTSPLHPDFGSRLYQGYPNGMSINHVPINQPLVTVHLGAYASESDPGPVPIPANALVEGPTDRHLIIVRDGTCDLWEAYHAVRQSDGSWNVDQLSHWVLTSNALRPNTWTSADAAGLPIMPGLVTKSEVASGAIHHAIRFTATSAAIRSTGFIWPARHSDGLGSSTNTMPMGSRFRLKASVNISGYDPKVQIILTALKQYGMILADSGGPMDISGSPDPSWNDDLLNAMRTVTARDFEIVDESGLMIDPNSGQVGANGSTPTPIRTTTPVIPPTTTPLPGTALPTRTATLTPTRTPIPPATTTPGVGGLPRPDHVVVVIMENHGYSQIIGNSAASYINGLATSGANLTNFFAIGHPSEPNYLELYSGSNQGVTDDSCPHTFSTGNLGATLASGGQSFATYSENLPGVGSTVCSATGGYARKHNPGVNFTNNPASMNQPFTAFPTDYTQLPTVSFVVPNLNNDMHDGSIAAGDAWVSSHMNAYKLWTLTHNSVLIVMFDEDGGGTNQIPAVVYGAHVRVGPDNTHYTHYNMLRTLLAFYGLNAPAGAAGVNPINAIWTSGLAASPSPSPTGVPATATATATPGAGGTLPPIPAGFPNHITQGYFNTDTATLNAPVEVRYQYLTGGVNTGQGWATWNSPAGQYVTNYIAASAAAHVIPAFMYYQILPSAPGPDEVTNLNNSATMNAYFADWKLLMQKAAGTGLVVVDLEPDLTGVLEQSATGNNATTNPVKVAASGYPDVAGYPNTFTGMYQALAHMRDVYAPNVRLGVDVSAWGAGADVVLALRDNPAYDWRSHAQRTGAYLHSLGMGDVLLYNPLDRDAAYYQAVQGSNRWWDTANVTQPTFNTMRDWLGVVIATTQKRAVLWQIPNGNRLYRSENNTVGHYQDNRAEYWLNGAAGRAHMTDWAAVGVMGFWYGAGAGGQSHYWDAQNDGVTNPNPVNNNNLVATVADDDGGFLRSSIAAYYSGGPIPLPGSGVAATATPIPIPATATSTPEISSTMRAAFTYFWFPETWRSLTNPDTHYHPTLGFYSSSDPAIVTQQIAALQYGHFQAGITSWWGQNSPTDGRIPLMLQKAAGTGFKWSLYYELEGTTDPSVAQIHSDLLYMQSKYWSDPSYLHRNNRPVVFVYGGVETCDMTDRWYNANVGINAYLVLKVFPGYAGCAHQADAMHQYGPASPRQIITGQSFNISPGFYKYNESTPRLTRDLARWQTDVTAMVASQSPWQLVTSFSEWGEGTAVESASEWASASGYGAYLDVLHNTP